MRLSDGISTANDLASFSSHGRATALPVDLVAPGSHITGGAPKTVWRPRQPDRPWSRIKGLSICALNGGTPVA
jgi:hypothetical protein